MTPPLGWRGTAEEWEMRKATFYSALIRELEDMPLYNLTTEERTAV